MKINPLVSVVITNYNYCEYIGKCIESVLGQTYSNIELIIINDGSTDRSNEVIEKYASQNAEIIYINQKNRGANLSRNKGIDIARGEYIFFLDADNWINSDHIEKLLKTAKKNNADVVYTDLKSFGDQSGVLRAPEFNLNQLKIANYVDTSSLVKQKSVGDSRFDPWLNRRFLQDYDFFLGLALKGLVFTKCSGSSLNYRVHARQHGYQHNAEKMHKYIENYKYIIKKYSNIYPKEFSQDIRFSNNLFTSNVLLKQVNCELESRIEGLSREKATLLSENSRLKNDIESIHKSKSWMLTKPLRRIKRIEGSKSYKMATKVSGIKKVVLHGNKINNGRSDLAFSQYNFNMKYDKESKLAVIVHLYYPDLWPCIADRLKSIKQPFDVYVSIVESGLRLEKVSKFHRATNIITFPNRGRDVLPFLIILKRIQEMKQYEFVLKLHSKKSKHRKDGGSWFKEILEELLPERTTGIIDTLSKHNTGMVGPSAQIVSLSRYIGDNKQEMNKLLIKMSNRERASEILHTQDYNPFFGGTMFWARVDYFNKLLDLPLTPDDFPEEDGQVDGTIAHAIERVIGRPMHRLSQRRMYTVDKDGKVEELEERAYTDTYKHV